MELSELLDKLPTGLKPVAVQYGPALIQMTADEVWAWVELLISGKTAEAYKTVIDKLPPSEKLALMAKDIAKWNELNTKNAAKVGLQREAAIAVLKALLTIALAMVGL